MADGTTPMISLADGNLDKSVHFLEITNYIRIEKCTYKSSFESFLTELEHRRNFIFSIIRFKHGWPLCISSTLRKVSWSKWFWKQCMTYKVTQWKMPPPPQLSDLKGPGTSKLDFEYNKIDRNELQVRIYLHKGTGTKMTDKLTNLTEKNESFLFLCLYANRWTWS